MNLHKTFHVFIFFDFVIVYNMVKETKTKSAWNGKIKVFQTLREVFESKIY